MIQGLIDWLPLSAEIDRVVNTVYLVIVLCIALTVLTVAIIKKNRNVLLLYLFSISIWLYIEGIGIVTGVRDYTSTGWLYWVTYVVLAVGEDKGWVTLWGEGRK